MSDMAERMKLASDVLREVDEFAQTLWPGTDAAERAQVCRIQFERVRNTVAEALRRRDNRQRMADVAASVDATLDEVTKRVATLTMPVKLTDIARGRR